jgi:hypothetical protein
MPSMKKLLLVAVGLIALATAGMPVSASAGGATLYELTENMKLDNLSKPTLRTASAALQGTSELGTPLCPAALVGVLTMVGLPTGTTCTLTAFGEDAVSLGGGNGSFSGAFAVVVNVDNAVDAPEFVVMTGTFGAQMQILADANGETLPLIRIANGTLVTSDVLGVPVAYVGMFFPGLTPEMFAPASFGGVFRLPFAVHNDKKVKPQKGVQAFYLGDTGSFIPVQQNETSLGYATVRVEIGF